MASKKSKSQKSLTLMPIICAVVSALTAIMFILPVYVQKAESALGSIATETTIFDLLKAMFDGNSLSTLFTIDTILFGLTFVLSIIVAVMFLVNLFIKNKAFLNATKMLALITAILGILGLVFCFIAMGDFNGNKLTTIANMTIGLGSIFACILNIATPICANIIKK